MAETGVGQDGVSQYSKDQKPTHPAFRKGRNWCAADDVAEVKIGEDGVSYMVGDSPFEFQYSYTETPKVRPVKLREPAVAPFGPATMPRPWTGRKPLSPSKKKLPEFDSFKLPSPHKKGVKPVQSPGPFLPGSGPKYVQSREEILGEPLTKEEIEELVKGCRKSRRQLNMGRDGLTHNMLENIHAHWKRRRVCKIKCLGVCTVDMDNVRQQLEDKTGGKVIYGSGGIIYLFRGRNYNYKTRPRYPLMLWKPTTPVYPRLVKRVPDGLTLDEASEMRKKGRNLIPICKLGKNGVYSNLVKNVREAFEACDLVRINCQGMNSSDYHKIGAKLKDLVPCVLISFECEHILMWRGREWTSSLLKPGDDPKTENSEIAVSLPSTSDSEDEGLAISFFSDSEELTGSLALGESTPPTSDEGEEIVVDEDSRTEDDSPLSPLVSVSLSHTSNINGVENPSTLDECTSDRTRSSSLWIERLLSQLKEAVDNGAAIVLDESSLNSDIVFETAVGLAKSAPPGPVFKARPKKVVVQKPEKQKTEDLKVENEKVLVIRDYKGEIEKKKKSYRRRVVMEGVTDDYTDVVTQGSLRVDELAKLLA